MNEQTSFYPGCGMKCPVAVAGKAPYQHQPCSDDLTEQIMRPDELHPHPHEQRVQHQTDCGDYGKPEDRVAVLPGAAEINADTSPLNGIAYRKW